MKKIISRLFVSGLLLVAMAFPSLASNHKKIDHPKSNSQSSQNATRGLERAAERRAEEAGEHGMDDMEKQREQMEHHDRSRALEGDQTGEKMQNMDKMKHEGKEKIKDADKMKHEGRERMQEGNAGIMDQAAEQAEKTPKKRRWYWPFGDAE